MTEPVLPDPARESLVQDLTPIIRRAIHAERRPLWREPWVWCLIAALIAGVAAFCLQRSSFDSKLAKKDQSIDSLTIAVDALSSQVRDLGGVPVATPSPGAQGVRGPGPTDAEISLAVSGYCAARDGCVGVPSRAQVADAVRAYCSTGVCKGAKGSRGASGAAGPSGASGEPGAAGVGPSSDDIAAAVSVYCAAHEGCTGPAGPQGSTGPQGSAGPQGDTGRGIASVDCDGLAITQLVIHYDDGTSQTVPCAPTDPQPSGSETP